MTRLWDKGAPLDERVLRYTAGEDYALDERLVAYDVRASIAHAEMLHAQRLLSARGPGGASAAALEALGAEHAARRLAHRARGRGRPDRARAAPDRAHRRGRRPRPPRPLAQRPGADGAAAVPARRGGASWPPRRAPAPQALRRARGTREARHRAARLHAHAAGHAELGARCGPAASPPSSRDDAAGLLAVQRRLGKSPLGSAAGYGTPGAADRPRGDARAARVRRPCTSRSPRCSCRAARPKRSCCSSCALLHAGPRSRFAADVLLFYTQEFGVRDAAGSLHHRLLDHAAEAQPRRVRAAARARRHRPGLPRRGARRVRQAALRLSARPAAASSSRCSAASTWPPTASPSCRTRSRRSRSGATPSGSIRRSTPPRKPTAWW